MKAQTKQTVLKASLLVILAANVSIHFPTRLPSMKNSNAFHISDLASETGLPGAAPAPVTIVTPVAAAVVPAVPVAKVGPQPDAPISTLTITDKTNSRTFLTCGEKFEIVYSEVTEDGKIVTRGLVNDIGPANATTPSSPKTVITIKKPGTLVDNVENKSAHDVIVAKVKASLQAKPVCQVDVADADPSVTAPPQPTPRDADADKAEAKRIAKGIKNCTLDKKGNPLKNGDERYECNLARLQNISLDTDDQDQDRDNDRDDKSDRRSRRDRPRRQKDGLSEVQDIVDGMKVRIKDLLLSRSEDKQDEGADRISDVVDALRDVRDTASGQDARSIDKMIAGINGLQVGAKLSREGDLFRSEANKRDDQIAKIRDQYNQIPAQVRAQNPMLQYQYAQAIDNLNTAKANIGSQMVSNPDFTNYTNLSQNGSISTQDYSDFTTDYLALYNSLMGRSSSTSLPGAAWSQDILNQRQTTASQFGQNNGGLTTVPQINYQALGLSAPQTSVTPTAFPQNQFGPQTQFNPQLGQNAQPTQFPQSQSQNRF